MDHFLPLLQQNPLFAGVEPAQLTSLLTCLGAAARTYARGQFIFRTGQPAEQVGVVCSGSVQVTTEDFTGNRTILARLHTGDLFGEAFACAHTSALPVNVAAAADSEILLLNYRKIITTCSPSCVFHARLIENMMGILAVKNVRLNQKLEILSRRSTREKLIAFLSSQAQAANGGCFTIPFNRQELADYLCVERSAMSTALGKLKKEGLLDFEKNTFRLLDAGHTV